MINIVIDTREQSPWQFPEELAATSRATLHQGDYALAGDHEFAIERKSVADFVGTIGRGWDRFCREFERMEMAGFERRVIIVEGSILDLFEYERTALGFRFMLMRVAQLVWMNIHVIFAGDAVHAAAVAYSILKRRKEQLT